MSNTSSCGKVFLTMGLLSLSLAASAFEDRSVGIYAEGGRAPHGDTGTDSLTLGVIVPFSPRQTVQGGAVSFYWDFFLSQWRAPVPDDSRDRSYTQIGVIGNWRYRFDKGASPWFVEAGLGGTVLDSIYHTPNRLFSTRFQFTEQIGLGRSFGANGEHELSVRLQHFSNANIKRPNPGENFVRVRYTYRF